MKKLFTNIKNTFGAINSKSKQIFIKIIAVITAFFTAQKAVLCDNRGENFIDSGFKVLIIVVLAALLLAGLYLLLGDVIMPTLTTRVKELFNYKG